MTRIQKAVNFSSGKWVSNAEMMKALGLKNSKTNPLRNIAAYQKFICRVHTNEDGEFVRYQAYSTEGKNPIELAKMRKQAGILAGIESIKFGGAA